MPRGDGAYSNILAFCVTCSQVIFILSGWPGVGDIVVTQKTIASLGLTPQISTLAFESRERFKYSTWVSGKELAPVLPTEELQLYALYRALESDFLKCKISGNCMQIYYAYIRIDYDTLLLLEGQLLFRKCKYPQHPWVAVSRTGPQGSRDLQMLKSLV